MKGEHMMQNVTVKFEQPIFEVRTSDGQLFLIYDLTWEGMIFSHLR